MYIVYCIFEKQTICTKSKTYTMCLNTSVYIRPAGKTTWGFENNNHNTVMGFMVLSIEPNLWELFNSRAVQKTGSIFIFAIVTIYWYQPEKSYCLRANCSVVVCIFIRITCAHSRIHFNTWNRCHVNKTWGFNCLVLFFLQIPLSCCFSLLLCAFLVFAL